MALRAFRSESSKTIAQRHIEIVCNNYCTRPQARFNSA
jgi:hypothetical protein